MPNYKGDMKKNASSKFAEFISTLIEAGVANCDEIGKNVGFKGNIIRGYKNYHLDGKKQCSVERQEIIIFYLLYKLQNADMEIKEQYRDLEEYIKKEVREWYERATDIYNYSPLYINIDGTNHIFGISHSIYERDLNCFLDMSNSEKGYILKYYFWDMELYSHNIEDIRILVSISNMSSEVLRKDWEEFTHKMCFDIRVLSPDHFTGCRKRIYKLACQCMNMALNPYSEYLENNKDENNYFQKFNEYLKDSTPTSARMFCILAPTFLKMTSEKWLFFAEYLFKKMEMAKDKSRAAAHLCGQLEEQLYEQFSIEYHRKDLDLEYQKILSEKTKKKT
ncbi:MAG: hypothetical protein K5669_11325 [Lachnospiraceae bacterium]|nr:hypothetical protein [Lachnospiraceae bacterium]